MTKYHVDKAIDITNNPQECILGKAPTLHSANIVFGNGTSEEWLVYQLSSLSEFAGAAKKITPQQIAQTARLIVGDFGYLKVTELMLFFRRFKTGRYGAFFGNVDPLIIISAIRSFLMERNDAIVEYEFELLKAQIEREKTHAVSYQTYLDSKPSET